MKEIKNLKWENELYRSQNPTKDEVRLEVEDVSSHANKWIKQNKN